MSNAPLLQDSLDRQAAEELGQSLSAKAEADLWRSSVGPNMVVALEGARQSIGVADESYANARIQSIREQIASEGCGSSIDNQKMDECDNDSAVAGKPSIPPDSAQIAVASISGGQPSHSDRVPHPRDH